MDLFTIVTADTSYVLCRLQMAFFKATQLLGCY